mmetsp:Transcript_47733/g.120166  ORF Transcript_47733/g.120166 Transcript_47733/m.120166 type:complete len:173 (-) Transcript_47733:960-1478(-)
MANWEENIASGLRYKELGNEELKAGELRKACMNYHFGILQVKPLTASKEYLSFESKRPVPSDNQIAEAKKAEQALRSNLSAALLKLKSYDRVVDETNRVLFLCSSDTKALYRRGFAHLELGNVDQALQDLQAAQASAPSDTAIIAKLKEARKRANTVSEQQEKVYRKMFGQS